MKMLAIIVTLFLCLKNSAVKSLTAEDFARFPEYRHLDRYTQCVDEADGVYCVATADLVADRPNQLYDVVTNYSYSAIRHLDYTKLRYGYCITRRCREFYTGDSHDELVVAMGLCMNKTLDRDYGMKARIIYATCYRHSEQKHSVTWLDCFAASIYASIAFMLVAGTVYDLFAAEKDPKGYLMCFSLPANWAKLTAPWPKDNTSARLIGINGIRAITTMVVIVTHANIPLPAALENPYALEEKVESNAYQIFGNSSIVVQTFLFLSGFFLAYTTQISKERKPLTWPSLPKAIFLRWLRLAPTYLLVILYSATWFKFIPYGPMWQEMVEDESQDCRRDWMAMLFFYNNYVYGSNCNPHHWSSAVDMHLHSAGLALLVLGENALRPALALLLALGVALPGIETYYRDLDGAFTSSGKIVHNMRVFNNYDTFNYLHKRTHTNIPAFIMGMAFGLFLYKWFKKPVETTEYKKYACLYWLTVPLMLSLMYSHSLLLLHEGAKPPMSVRILIAMFSKLLWSVCLIILIFGMVCRVENVYRSVLEWRGWVLLMRLGFCVFNAHMICIRWVYAADTQLTYLSDINLVNKLFGFMVLSYILALLLNLCVEAPSNNLIRKLFPDKKSVLEVKDVKKTE